MIGGKQERIWLSLDRVDAARRAGDQQGDFFTIRSRYRPMEPSNVKRLKVLEEENAHLKKMFFDLNF